MARSRYLFVMQDAGGTVPPFIALAQAAIARGDEVTVLGQPCIEQRAVSAGCGFEPFSEIGDYERTISLEDQLDIAGPLLVGPSPGRDVVRIARRDGADAVVVDCDLASAISAAESLTCRSVVLLHSMLRTFIDVWFAEYWPVLQPPLNEMRRSFALEEAASWIDLFSRQDAVLSVVPPAFEGPINVADNLTHTGFLVPAFDGRATIELPVGDDPLVLVSLSTSAFPGQDALLRSIVEALSGLPVRALVTAGAHTRLRDIAAAANVVIREQIPHAAVLPSVDAVITHAGLGTVAAALNHGVPMVCAPMGRDQVLNAERVGSVGAGVTVRADGGVDVIDHAVRAILGDAKYADGARAMARASRDAGGVDAALRAIGGTT